MNVTAASSLEGLLGWDEFRRHDFVAVQEMHVDADCALACEAKLQRQGWRAKVAPAVGARGVYGGCGGLACLVPQHHGLGCFEVGGDPVVEAGRAMVLSLTMGSCTLAWANLYLESGSELGYVNYGILRAVALRLRLLACPFVIAGDFNCSADAVVESGLLGFLDGEVVVPSLGTCRPAERVIDYFVVSRGLRCDAQTMTGWPVSPHRPVQLSIHCRQGAALIRVAVVPRALAPLPPHGCCPLDFAEHWKVARAKVEGLCAPAAAWKVFAEQAERQLCAIWCVDPAEAAMFSGRAEAPRLKWMPAKRPSQPRFPMVSVSATWWRAVRAALGAVAQLRFPMLRWRAALRAKRLAAMAPREVDREFVNVLAVVRQLLPLQVALLERLAQHMAEKLANEAMVTSRRRFTEWLDRTTFAPGAGGLHAVARLAPSWQPSPVQPGCTWRACSLQDEVEQLAAEWGKWWCIGQPFPDLQWPEDLGPRPPRPSVLLLRKVLATFKVHTGAGLDSWTPRQLLHLDDAGLECFLDVLMLIEKHCEWPVVVNKIVFLAKRTGGLRPIALIYLVARVQARLRRPIALEWEKRNDRSYWWAARGRSCEQAVWQQAAWSEWATYKQTTDGGQRRWSSAQVLLDLLKAFEQVKHHWLLQAAVEYGFPLWQLKLQVLLFRAPRWLSLGQACSAPLTAMQAILPGDGWATTLLKLALIGPLDATRRLHRSVTFAVVVDDIILQREGGEARVTGEVAGAALELHRQLALADIRVALKKSRALSNNAVVRMELQGRLGDTLGVRAARCERNLGVDAACGRRLLRHVRKDRLKNGLARMQRIRAVLRARRPARGKVAGAGLLPALDYGVSVTGLAEAELQSMRTQVFKAIEARPEGKSRTLALMLMPQKHLDPIFAATLEPVVALATALWEQWLPRKVLSDCMDWTCGHVRSWGQVRGPLAAALLSMRRVGWSWMSVSCWQTRGGTRFDPCEVGPWVVKKLLTRDVVAWQWDRVSACKESPELQHLAGGGLLQPIRRLLGADRSARGPLPGKQRSYLRSVVVNGQWPMQRLHQHGYVDTPGCKCCGEVGTLLHRHAGCREMRRGRDLPKAIAVAAGRAQEVVEARVLLERCLWPLARPAMPEGVRERRWVRGHGYLQGRIYLDGSVFEARCELAAVGAWAAVCFRDGAADVEAIVSGPLCELVVDIDGAELTALIECLTVAVPPVVVVTDSDFVYKGVLQRGRAATTGRRAAWPHLWARFWRLLDDFGEDNMKLLKVASHTTVADVAAGRISAEDRRGNAAADAAAKDAVHAARESAASRVRRKRGETAVEVAARWVAQVGAEAAEVDTEHLKRAARLGAARVQQPAEAQEGPPGRPHVLALGDDGGRWCRVCRRCLPPSAWAGACEGEPVVVWLQDAQAHRDAGRKAHVLARVVAKPDSHLLPTAVCLACGALGVLRPRALRAPCPQRPSPTGARILRALCRGRLLGQAGVQVEVLCAH